MLAIRYTGLFKELGNLRQSVTINPGVHRSLQSKEEDEESRLLLEDEEKMNQAEENPMEVEQKPKDDEGDEPAEGEEKKQVVQK